VRSARRRTSTPGGLADTAAVGLVRDGALVVAYHDGVSRAVVRRGAVGGALGAPQALAQVRNRPDFSAAIDDAGTATVAFGRSLGRDGIGVAVARARPGSAFGVPVTLDRGPNAQVPQVAAAGSTTAVTWLSLTARERVRVVIARDAGRFGRPLTPATAIFELRGEAGRVPSEAGVPTVGDGVFAATGLGRPVLTRAPDVTLSRPSVAELRRTGAVTVTARCAPRCEIVANARLTTGRGGPGLVISRQARPPQMIAANATAPPAVALTPAGRTALQATGRAQVKVIVTAANVSGSARTARQAFDVGRRSR
jgi:hypothetical protein